MAQRTPRWFGPAVLARCVLGEGFRVALASSEAARFPGVSGFNLNGRAKEIPRGPSGRVNLAFVAFTRLQQREVNSWPPFVAEATREFPYLSAYELPAPAKPFALVRGYLDGIMRTGIPGKRAFDRKANELAALIGSLATAAP